MREERERERECLYGRSFLSEWIEMDMGKGRRGRREGKIESVE